MSVLTKSKKEVVKTFAQDKKDTGSVEVQCAVITKQINSLIEHLKIHKKDFSIPINFFFYNIKHILFY